MNAYDGAIIGAGPGVGLQCDRLHRHPGPSPVFNRMSKKPESFMIFAFSISAREMMISTSSRDEFPRQLQTATQETVLVLEHLKRPLYMFI